MAKGFGKVLLTSSVLAGAALGAYMYFKQEGVIDETKSPAENAAKIKDKVTADAAEYFNKDRSYVDLNDAVEGVKSKAADVVSNVKDTVSGVVSDVKKAASNTAEDVKEAAEDVKESAEDAVEEVKEAAADTFEPGLAADKISADSSKTIGGTISEEFFNDEA